MLAFKTNTIIYDQSQTGNNVFRDESTLGYIFINTGAAPVEINNFVLNSGAVWKTFEPLCKDDTIYKINFKQNLVQNNCALDNSQLTTIIYSKA